MSYLKNTFDTVKKLLEDYPKFRDNDELLVVQIWHSELKRLGIDSKTIPAMDFFNIYKENKLTPADLITRARRRVCELHENLRGKSYKPRKKKQEEWKKEMADV